MARERRSSKSAAAAVVVAPELGNGALYPRGVDQRHAVVAAALP
jgi:hypothetical protein